MNEEICNCVQCQELRQFERITEYFNDVSNCVSLTPAEVETFFRISKIRKNSIADILINKFLVVCKDGFIRKR